MHYTSVQIIIIIIVQKVHHEKQRTNCIEKVQCTQAIWFSSWAVFFTCHL